jgi:hypothetical protein
MKSEDYIRQRIEVYFERGITAINECDPDEEGTCRTVIEELENILEIGD